MHPNQGIRVEMERYGRDPFWAPPTTRLSPRMVEDKMKDHKRCSTGLPRSPLPVLLLTFILVTGGAVSAAAAPPGPAGHEPVIADSFAVSSIWGGPWMVFVEGFDPKGDMIYLWFEVTQLGGHNSTEIVYLKGENRRRFSGYVAIHMPTRMRGWETVRVEIKAKDADGNYSEKRTHEVMVGAPTREGVPEKWRMATANRLGNIFFPFETDHSDRMRSHWDRD